MTTTPQQIIALGGGGFSMEPENLALDQYILEQAGADVPNVCFLPTASGDSEGYVVNFFGAMAHLRCTPSMLGVWLRARPDFEAHLMAQDVIYVGGGNTMNMLAIWRAWGIDQILRRALEQGVVLAGISAGAICWFEQGLTDSIPGRLSALPCLGFLKDSCTPHYNGEAKRRPTYLEMVGQQQMGPGVAIDDSCGVHYIDGVRHRVVASKPDAHAYLVSRQGDEAQEERLPAQLLDAVTV